MNEMIERVARILSEAGDCPREHGQTVRGAWWWGTRYDHPRNAFAHECRADDVRQARAALAELREPTPAMVKAAFDALVPASDAKACWAAMIDAALEDGQK